MDCAIKDNRLPDKFFEECPIDDKSLARSVYESFVGGNEDCQLDTLLEELENEGETERAKGIRTELLEIPRIQSAEEIVRKMRANYDIANSKALADRALELQQSVMPLLLRRYTTSYLDPFIQCAVLVLKYADMQYIDQLVELYPKIRNPYAQSMACLIFGIRGKVDCIPLLLGEYMRMRDAYDNGELVDEDDIYDKFEEGPLLALHILHGRA